MIEPREVVFNGEVYIFDPDVTVEQAEKLEIILPNIISTSLRVQQRALDMRKQSESAKTEKEVTELGAEGLIHLSELNRELQKDHYIRKALSIILLPKGQEYTQEIENSNYKMLGKLKGDSKKAYEGLMPVFFRFVTNYLESLSIYTMLKPEIGPQVQEENLQ